MKHGSAHFQSESVPSSEWRVAIRGYGSLENMPRCAIRRSRNCLAGLRKIARSRGQNQWLGSVGMGGRRALESVAGMDRNTQPPTKIDPQLSRQSGTLHRQTVRVRGSMRSSFGVSVSHHPRGMVMYLALLIRGEAMISLGAKAVRHAGWMLSALDYGNVRDVSHLGKHRDGLPIQGDLEVRMERE